MTLLFSNITSTQKASGEGLCEGGLQNTGFGEAEILRERTCGLKSQACALEDGCVFLPLPPRDITLLSSAMSQIENQESLLSRYKEVSEGLQFPPLLWLCLPLAHRGPEKTPKFHTMKAGRIPFYNFFFFFFFK